MQRVRKLKSHRVGGTPRADVICILSYLISSYLATSYPVTSYPVISYHILSYLILSYLIDRTNVKQQLELQARAATTALPPARRRETGLEFEF
jgi:hypothetical protein